LTTIAVVGRDSVTERLFSLRKRRKKTFIVVFRCGLRVFSCCLFSSFFLLSKAFFSLHVYTELSRLLIMTFWFRCSRMTRPVLFAISFLQLCIITSASNTKCITYMNSSCPDECVSAPSKMAVSGVYCLPKSLEHLDCDFVRFIPIHENIRRQEVSGVNANLRQWGTTWNSTVVTQTSLFGRYVSEFSMNIFEFSYRVDSIVNCGCCRPVNQALHICGKVPDDIELICLTLVSTNKEKGQKNCGNN